MKSLHIVFVVTWFAALFYIVRLFIYQTEGARQAHSDLVVSTLQIMSWRLWYMISWPSALLSLLCGGWIAVPWWGAKWLWLKIGLVGILLVYHLVCHVLFLKLQKNMYLLTSFQLRLLNEVTTLLLFAIVFLAVFKRMNGLWQSIAALTVLAVILLLTIRIYKTYRNAKS